MAKEKVLLIVLILAVILSPGISFGKKTIQTTQRIIVLDPGHGGTDKGIIAPNGIEEKTITLKLAKKIAQTLKTRYNVFLTRDDDTKSHFRERMFFANKKKANLTISLHLNNSYLPSVFCYFFDPPATNQNPPAPNDMWKSQTMLNQNASKQAIVYFLKVFSKNTESTFFSKGAPVKIIEGATMPAILIEPFSISTLPQHSVEMESIISKYALIIAESIDRYFSAL